MSGQTQHSITKLEKEFQNSLAMTVTLISFGMLFATFFLMYALYRGNEAIWPPMGIVFKFSYPALFSTLIILASSFTYHRCYQDFLNRKAEGSKLMIVLTTLLGGGFLISQWALWRDLKMAGISAESGIFGSIIYGMTWTHFAHIVLGLAGLIWMMAQIYSSAGTENFKVQMRIKNMGMFWHFLGAIWLLIFFTVFIF